MRIAYWSAIGTLCAAALVGCADAPTAPETGAAVQAPALAPWMTIQGGWSSATTQPLGVAQGPRGPFVPLRYPAAVAVAGNDVLIADAGVGRIYRFDLAQQVIVPVPGVRATPNTRVALGVDLSAYVLEPGARQLVRIARDGRPIQTIRNDQVLVQPIDFALRETSGEIVFADATLAQLVTLRTASGIAFAATPFGADGVRAGQVAAIAAGDGRVCFSDPSARAVRCAANDARKAVTLRDEALQRPGSLVLDRFGRVLVHDTVAGDIKLFESDRLVATVTAAEIGVTQVTGMAIDGNFIAVADGPGAKVALFFLRPPRK